MMREDSLIGLALTGILLVSAFLVVRAQVPFDSFRYLTLGCEDQWLPPTKTVTVPCKVFDSFSEARACDHVGVNELPPYLNDQSVFSEQGVLLRMRQRANLDREGVAAVWADDRAEDPIRRRDFINAVVNLNALQSGWRWRVIGDVKRNGNARARGIVGGGRNIARAPVGGVKVRLIQQFCDVQPTAHVVSLKNVDHEHSQGAEGRNTSEHVDPPVGRRLALLFISGINAWLCGLWGLGLIDRGRRWFGCALVGIGFSGLLSGGLLWFLIGFRWSWCWWL